MQDSLPTSEPRYFRFFRVVLRVVFAWWVIGGALGLVMSALVAEWVGVGVGAAVCAAGVFGWRLAGRPISDANSLLTRIWVKLNERSKQEKSGEKS